MSKAKIFNMILAVETPQAVIIRTKWVFRHNFFRKTIVFTREALI